PATDIIQLAFGSAPGSDTQILLTDMAGRTLGSWIMPAGSSARQTEVGEIPEGIYLISVSNSEGRGVRKVIIR
ncbi:MAG: T9SS type A sorting domain-containing protein, partial [Bacteroidota bacterium]